MLFTRTFGNYVLRWLFKNKFMSWATCTVQRDLRNVAPRCRDLQSIQSTNVIKFFGRNARVVPQRVGSAGGSILRSTQLSVGRALRSHGTGIPSSTNTSASTLQGEKYGDRFFNTEDERPIILFDGVCNLYVSCLLPCRSCWPTPVGLLLNLLFVYAFFRCNGAVNFMLDWDVKGKCRFAALQSEAGQELLQRAGRSREDISSMVLVEKDESYIKSDAVLRTAQYIDAPILPMLASLGMLAVPKPFRDFFYDGVANSRYNFFGRSSTCRINDPRFNDRFVS